MRDGARLGIDVGGTFVDFALAFPAGDLLTHKALADPSDLAGSVLKGLEDLASLQGESCRSFLSHLDLMVHGTTAATNAVLTRNGNRTGLITTAGTRDALEMRRGIKEEPLNNKYQAPPPLVPRYLRLPVTERMNSAGKVLIALDRRSVDEAIAVLDSYKVESVAICLMHSYANDSHELAVAARVRQLLPETYITVSSDLMPQLGYYSRLSTTVLNSYVGLLLRSYLVDLSGRLVSAGYSGRLLIMNSAGGVMSPNEISERAVTALLSGPAAGPIAGRLYTRDHGIENFAVIDMGGTSLDISLAFNGEPIVTREGRIDRYGIGLPMIDIRTIGAGGGSIAWLDEGGALHVGPQSAGALPGPACYGSGGEFPTCTDADVLLGFIEPDYFLGGRMKLDRSAAENSIRTHLANPLGLSMDEAAISVFEVINANMAAGIRDMIVDHGLDPRATPLVVGGGAGPVHAGALASELGISQVIIPRQAGVFCAIGMVFTDLKYDLVRSYYVPLSQLDSERWRAIFESMARKAYGAMLAQTSRPENIETRFSADLRYSRQMHELTVPLTSDQVARPDTEEIHNLFDRLHDHLFGYCLPHQSLDLVNLRATCIGRLAKPATQRSQVTHEDSSLPNKLRRAYVSARRRFEKSPVYAGEDFVSGVTVEGPTIVELPETTIVVPVDFSIRCDPHENFVLTNLWGERGEKGAAEI